ncbi:sulfite exporter TauE/SafE family protein [Aquimarina sp. W85]|uniref:sulfite exporter TauE/SafE family protein n=1 Tax=Aquimarina rhodophyticola TaxID=3342246 RepID=UPI00366B3310
MFLSAILLGLLGSFHCIGMCGPIAFMLPLSHHNSIKKLVQLALYHIGRLVAYGILGVFFGAIGKQLYLFGLQQKLSIIIGVLMIIIVLIPQHTFAKNNLSKPIYRVLSKLKSSLGMALKQKTPDTFLTIGFLNGFLPCGLVYMAVFGAMASSSLIYGGLYMLFFGLGTIPLMTITVYAGSLLGAKQRLRIQKLIPMLVILIGLLFVLRGLGLGIPYLSPKPPLVQVTANMECY